MRRKRSSQFPVLSSQETRFSRTENWELRAENPLIELLSRTKRHVIVLNRFLRLLRLRRFFSGAEDAFFVAADALVRVQAFQNKFRGRHLLLGSIFRADVHSDSLVHEPLDG